MLKLDKGIRFPFYANGNKIFINQVAAVPQKE